MSFPWSVYTTKEHAESCTTSSIVYHKAYHNIVYIDTKGFFYDINHDLIIKALTHSIS